MTSDMSESSSYLVACEGSSEDTVSCSNLPCEGKGHIYLSQCFKQIGLNLIHTSKMCDFEQRASSRPDGASGLSGQPVGMATARHEQDTVWIPIVMVTSNRVDAVNLLVKPPRK